MDFILPDKARRDIVDLSLAQIVLDAFDEKPLTYALDSTIRFPYMIFSLSSAEQARYGIGPITPIWTDVSGYVVVAFHHEPTRRGFYRFYIEGAGEEQPIALSWQQVLVKEFKYLWEME